MSDPKEPSLPTSGPAAPASPSSPTSPLPARASSTKQYYACDETSPAPRRDGILPQPLPRQLHSSEPLPPSEDPLSEAVSRLSVRESPATSSSRTQTRTKSQDTSRPLHDQPPHRVRSVDDIRQPPLPRERAPTEIHEAEHRLEAYEPSETEWVQGQGGEEYHQEQRTRGEPQACLFVASLAASRTDVELVDSVTEHFRRWGPLLNVKVLKDWMQRPYSFVQFEHVEDAQRAMAEAQNTIIDGRHIRIEQARVNRTLFILKFGRSTTEQDLIDVLEQYGSVEDVSIFQDLGPSRNKRYAFAKFAYRDDAIKAYMSLRSSSKWTVEWAPNLSNQNQIEKESVFIGQLNPELATEGALHERFQDHGNIQHVHLVKRTKPGTNRPTAFAFIEYDDEDSARRAIEHENNTVFLGTTIRVQHREASEYRVQRQNAAIQAARSLNMAHPVGPPPIGMPTPPIHTPEYRGTYQPYRASGGGRPMYYTTYYTYAPPGMPMGGQGFLAGPQSGAMYVQPSGAPRRGHGLATDAGMPYGNQTNRQSTSADQYGTTQDTRSGQQGYDYAAYVQAPEGVYYPQPVPTRMFMYDQGPGVTALAPLSPSPTSVTPAGQPTLGGQPANPIWYGGLVRPMGNSIKRPGTEALGAHLHYGVPAQARPPDACLSSSGTSSSLDSRGQSRKSA